jgi:hypothetical protein
MSSLALRAIPHAVAVRCTEDELVRSLSDGRVLPLPLAWFPRLTHATPEQLSEFELLGQGEGIHWPSIVGIIEGRPAVEYQAALA